MSEIIKADINDLVQDDRNGNKGTERGSKMLQQSIKDCGIGRSVLVDRNGRLIAGNKTQLAAIANGVEEVIVVRTDGTQLVAVQRTDLDLDEPKARKLAWVDNRISEVNYDPDLDKLLEDINNGIDLSFYYERTELDEMLDEMCAEQARSGEGEEAIESEDGFEELTLTVPASLANRLREIPDWQVKAVDAIAKVAKKTKN